MTTNTNAALISHLQALGDRAYCDYIAKMKTNECLGWEEKVRTKKFGQAELTAHTKAGELLGKHRAFAEAVAALTTAAAVPAEGVVMVPVELANRVQESLGEFLMDHGWSQRDMDTSDEFGAVLLAAAPKAEPVQAGEYPPLPRPFIFAHESGGVEWPDTFDATQMRAYADATCAMRAQAAPAAVAGPSQETCQTCQGNGEVVTDWERYKHPLPGDVGDEAVAECQDCDGQGTVDAAPTTQAAPQPAVQQGAGTRQEPVGWQAARAHPTPPAVVEPLTDGLLQQHNRDSQELRRLCAARDQARSERDVLKAEIAGLESSCSTLGRLVDELRPDAERLEWVLRRCAGSWLRSYLGAVSDTGDMDTLRTLIDANRGALTAHGIGIKKEENNG